MMTEETKHDYVWGTFHKYPKCCIEYFTKVHYSDRPVGYMTGHPADGSGYIPCPECYKKMRTVEDIVLHLGSDPHEDCGECTYIEYTKSVLQQLNTRRYKTIAKQFEYDYTEYQGWLEDCIGGGA